MAGESMKEWLLRGGDAALLEGLCWFLLGVGALVATLQCLNVRVPYGRYGNSGGQFLSTLLLTDVKMPAKLGWFLMELPSFVVPLYLILDVGGEHIGKVNPNIVFLGMFLLHYFNRSVRP